MSCSTFFCCAGFNFLWDSWNASVTCLCHKHHPPVCVWSVNYVSIWLNVSCAQLTGPRRPNSTRLSTGDVVPGSLSFGKSALNYAAGVPLSVFWGRLEQHGRHWITHGSIHRVSVGCSALLASQQPWWRHYPPNTRTHLQTIWFHLPTNTPVQCLVWIYIIHLKTLIYSSWKGNLVSYLHHEPDQKWSESAIKRKRLKKLFP